MNNRIIVYNVKMKKRFPNFPSLPKIFKKDRSGKISANEINKGHTESVMRGYFKRVKNFKIQQKINT